MERKKEGGAQNRPLLLEFQDITPAGVRGNPLGDAANALRLTADGDHGRARRP